MPVCLMDDENAFQDGGLLALRQPRVPSERPVRTASRKLASRLTTLTRETFIPGFLERDEGERELPYAKYPWDGISGVRPFRALAATTTVGVY